jgi:hypothetical protein
MNEHPRWIVTFIHMYTLKRKCPLEVKIKCGSLVRCHLAFELFTMVNIDPINPSRNDGNVPREAGLVNDTQTTLKPLPFSPSTPFLLGCSHLGLSVK